MGMQEEKDCLRAELLETCRLFMFDGVPMTEVRLSFPHFTGKGAVRLNAFYEGLREGCLSYAQGALTELSKQRYLESDPARRRFLHRRLLYSHTVRLLRVKDFLSLRREVSLFYRGRLAGRRIIGEVVDREGRFCTPRQFLSPRELRAAQGGRRGIYAVSGFYLDEGGRLVIPEDMIKRGDASGRGLLGRGGV